MVVGLVRCYKVADRLCHQAESVYPLKLIATKSHVPMHVAIFIVTYGGGLLGGDIIEISVQVEAGTLSLLTPSATKVYKQATLDNVMPCRQLLDATAGPNAFLQVLPHPVILFKDAVYTQKQRIHMHSSSSLVLLDWFTSGRKSRGEEWDFKCYHSENRVYVDGKLAFYDAMMLRNDMNDQRDYALHRKSGYSCFCLLVLIGSATRPLRDELEHRYEHELMQKKSELQWTCSKMNIGTKESADEPESSNLEGTVVRMCGKNSSQLYAIIQDLLNKLPQHVQLL